MQPLSIPTVVPLPCVTPRSPPVWHRSAGVSFFPATVSVVVPYSSEWNFFIPFSMLLLNRCACEKRCFWFSFIAGSLHFDPGRVTISETEAGQRSPSHRIKYIRFYHVGCLRCFPSFTYFFPRMLSPALPFAVCLLSICTKFKRKARPIYTYSSKR
jgi:hypothetical protein